MKIILISNSMWSIFNFRRELIKKFLNKNYEIHVIAGDDNYNKQLIKIGCKTKVLNFNGRKINIISEFVLFIKIILTLKQIKPDYVINFTIKPIIISGLVCRILKFKYISVITGMGKIFTNNKNSSLLGKILYKLTNLKAYKVFLQNKHDFNYFVKIMDFPKDRLVLIPGSGVDIRYFKKKKYPEENNKLIFTNISRIVREKGIEEYLEIAKIIKSKYSFVEFNLIGSFAGDINLLNKVKKSNQEKIINYIEHNHDIRQIIEQSHCLVLLSHREGMPRSLLEGSAISRPIITTDCIGSNEIIIDNYNGFKCETKSINSIIEAIEKFINLNYTERKTLGINARNYVEKNFDINFVINKFLDVIN